MFVRPAQPLAMRSVTEGSISAELAVAELVVATLADVECDRAVASQYPLALSITPGMGLGVTTAAPVVHLPTIQIHLSGEHPCEVGQGGRTVAAFLVGS